MKSHDYHADPRIGSTTLKRILTSPQHMQHGIVSASPSTLALGTAIHTCTLEPSSEFVIVPALDLRSKAGKDAALNWIADNGGTLPDLSKKIMADDIRAAITTVPDAITSEDYDIARYVAKSVWFSTRARKLLTGAAIEQSYFFERYKARPDATNGDWLIDLKSTADVSYHKFAAQAERLKYGFSLHHYKVVMSSMDNPITIRNQAWICVASKPDREINGRPVYPVEVYEVGQDIQDAAWQQWEKADALYAECLRNGEFPPPPEPETATIINRPEWANNGE